MIQKTPSPDNDPFRLPSHLKQPYHKPNLIGRIGEQARLLCGPKSLLLGLAIASLCAGGGRFLLSQNSRSQNSQSQTNQAQEANTSSNAANGLATASSANPPQSVTLATAQLATLEDIITLTGTVVPRELVQVAPSLSGLRIEEMWVKVGDRVQAGQIIATLDNSLFRTALAQAEANLAQAQAQITQLEARLAQASIVRQAARTDINRYSRLYQQGAISQAQLDERQIQSAATQEGIAVIAANLDSAHANVASKLADIQRIQTQLDQTAVISPVSGTIAQKLSTIGSVANGPLYSIIENAQLDLVVKPTQAQLSNVEVGTPALVETAGTNSDRLRSSVYAIEPTLDAQNRQATVKIDLANAPVVKPGMFLQADLVTQRRRGVVVPAKAVIAQPDGSALVYTLSASESGISQNSTGKAIATPVKIAQIPNSADRVEILSGLAAGDRVVVSGANYLQDGDSVSLSSSPASP